MSDNPAVKQQKETPAENLNEIEKIDGLTEAELAKIAGGRLPAGNNNNYHPPSNNNRPSTSSTNKA